MTVRLVEPPLFAEVAADVSMDSAGRWRHPVRLVRVRDDLTPAEVPLYGGRGLA
ncbi:ATP-dependent DNA ligase [Streptomyces venezuelae]|uniref:ATP-dependent DNA ligase n=1 Tax=Streptomyces venezuelae TaxID=54571 RepID=A0A5P2BSZ1_STRVZ|nr:ATP-dependent DNA ligase [Streptomyces venezuelae]